MLTKDSFPLTHLFLYYQTLENTENYLYTKFFIETNGAVAYNLKRAITMNKCHKLKLSLKKKVKSKFHIHDDIYDDHRQNLDSKNPIGWVKTNQQLE